MKRRFPNKNNVLLVNITRLGDMLQATPTIAGIKMENPEAKITVLVEKQFLPVCHYIPNINDVIGLDFSMIVRALQREGGGIIDAYKYVSEAVEDLRSRKFDYCLNMSSSAYTALLINLIGITNSGGWTADEEGYRRIESDWAKLFASSVFHQNRQFNSLNLVDVFRCSADVERHPCHLLMNLEPESREYARSMFHEAGLADGEGPLIAVQAGASQAKRQWSPQYFARLLQLLRDKLDARLVLIGSAKELSIVTRIAELAARDRILVAAGKTSIPQLGAILEQADLLVTGDTGPMHMSVAVGTPVVSMFLASAYGFETGPYSEGNIVIQPVIGCGPCNPNKSCTRPDCHDQVSPEAVFELVRLRLAGDFRQLPEALVEPSRAIIYRTAFDEFGFYKLEEMHPRYSDRAKLYREAYRKLWLDDLAGYSTLPAKHSTSKLSPSEPIAAALTQLVIKAEEGRQLIDELLKVIRDVNEPPSRLGYLNSRLSELDREIEVVGFHFAPLGPLTRMFIFGKENLDGTEAESLASEMGEIYDSLKRRCTKFAVAIAAVKEEQQGLFPIVADGS